MEDPSLIIYHPVRVFDGKTIVTNGDQTDTIRDTLPGGSLLSPWPASRAPLSRTPPTTPPASPVLVKPDGSYNLSILKSFDGDPSCCCRYFFEYDAPVAGYGHFIHTYQGRRQSPALL